MEERVYIPKDLEEKVERICEWMISLREEDLEDPFLQSGVMMLKDFATLEDTPLRTSSKRDKTWACGLLHAAGNVMGMFNEENLLYINEQEFLDEIGISKATCRQVSNEIWTSLGLGEVRDVVIEMQNEFIADRMHASQRMDKVREEQHELLVELVAHQGGALSEEEQEQQEEAYKYVLEQMKQGEENRVAVAKEAIAISPYCFTVYAALIYEADSVKEAIYWSKLVLSRLEEFIGIQWIGQAKGLFSFWPEGREYLKYKLMLAECYAGDEQWAKAIETGEEIQVLDELKVTDIEEQLAYWYIAIGKSVRGKEWILKADDDELAVVMAKILIAIKEKKKKEAIRGIKEAYENNPYIWAYMCGERDVLDDLGRELNILEEEAINYIHKFFHVWIDTKGIEWIFSCEEAMMLARAADAMVSFDSNEGPVRAMNIGRNDPCPCGSNKKYKKCCGK